MKNYLTKISRISSFILIFLSSFTFSSSQYTARITSFNTSDHSGGSSLTYFVLENNGTRTTTTCTYSYWVVNTDNMDEYKTQVSLLLTAFSQNKPINIVGTGNCNSGGEIADYIWVTN
jgi:hypothetical protein